MNRRELVKKSFVVSMGLSLSPGILLSLESCAEQRPTSDVPVYLDQEQFDHIWQIAELVLPKTDSPGANDAKVTPFIDQLFGLFFEDEEKTAYMDGLNSFMLGCQDVMGASFLKLDNNKQVEYLEIADDDTAENSFFKSIKWIILWAYFTSEPGMKSMNYVPVPGRFNGCIKIDGNEKNLVGNR
ncbi:gluconate 2-dehydrogenase subunit 3 family protein [Lutimonas sp.]|uniref:gluconate 2-dehydrogenase subunit 3 family protein n=1 Tax=Lutimonas sp. TaxID=1872403 RepID=UPI003D9BA341